MTIIIAIVLPKQKTELVKDLFSISIFKLFEYSLYYLTNEEFSKQFSSFYSFEGLPPEKGVTAKDQLNEFSRQIAQQFKAPYLGTMIGVMRYGQLVNAY
ncbi:hypothetical protein [Candidatus Tisiphia endosymbiont of Sialis lutaria]|uniref:hypothetical protein n=1 Tax=Candidatus Tisiphia endosymbiont of Sialis lutaria TaxID=2029164 RepID=UPI00312CB147